MLILPVKFLHFTTNISDIDIYLEVTVFDFTFVLVCEFITGGRQQIILCKKFPQLSDLIPVNTAVGQAHHVNLKVTVGKRTI